MAQSVPLNLFVSATPEVLSAAGASLGMNGVVLTENDIIPIGWLQLFGSAAEVGSWFGLTSTEYYLAQIYFAGYNGGSQTPAVLYFAQYNAAAVAAYVRGATLSLTLAQLQALTGTITIAINGETVQSGTINLASATSFSQAAALIQTGLQVQGGIFEGTASTTSGSDVLTVSAVTSGALHVGDTITDTAGALPVGTTILSFGTGTGGAGTYNLSAAATATNASDPVFVSSTATVSYNANLEAFEILSPTTGVNSTVAFPTDTSLSPSLLLTQAKGAVQSLGAAAATPAGTMTSIENVTQDWFSFMTAFDPDNGAAGGPLKQQFAQWAASKNAQYLYIGWDTDATPSNTLPDSACFAAQVSSLIGTCPIWDSTALQAAEVSAFVAGAIASINFNETNGRLAFDAKGSPALTPDITSESVFLNVTGTASVPGNGYNCYAAVASRTSSFQWFERGTVTGKWAWLDSYVNQAYWTAALQEALATYKNTVKNIPYTTNGYNGVAQALQSTINDMGNFGAWQKGVALSAAEIQAANQDAGLNIGTTLQNQGWYLLIQDPGATVRAARGSPIIKLYYVDGGSVQTLAISVINVQ